MHARPKDITLLAALHFALSGRLKESRFTAKIELSRKDDRELEIKYVRLKVKKDYCGQHPGPCVVNPFAPEKKHTRSSCLEGADWVGFNALLNDLCDERSWEVDIWSYGQEFKGKMRIRRGRLRRVNYDSEFVGPFGHQAWDAPGEDEDFEDWCGRVAPPARYPADTPGLASWRLETVAANTEDR